MALQGAQFGAQKSRMISLPVCSLRNSQGLPLMSLSAKFTTVLPTTTDEGTFAGPRSSGGCGRDGATSIGAIFACGAGCGMPIISGGRLVGLVFCATGPSGWRGTCTAGNVCSPVLTPALPGCHEAFEAPPGLAVFLKACSGPTSFFS